MSRHNSHDHAFRYGQGSPSFPYPTTHRDNQAVATQVARLGMSPSLLAEGRFTVPRGPPDVPDVLSLAPCGQRPAPQTFAGGLPAGMYRPTDNLRARRESTPPGSVARIGHSSYVSNISRETRSPSYHPPRPHPYFTPPVSPPASRNYCPSPDIIGNIERSVPGRHRQSNLRSCRWDTDNASCSSSVTGSRAEIENHLRAYHRVRDDVRTVICLWEGCVRTRPLRRENLARHVMTHMNIRWECPECKKLFSRSDAVQRHVERVCPRRGYDAA
ncbi:hypothetical protein BKA82DRAFT_995540 [Pisolithus tinctorius]|uniref:C2H2-type domain-containing protein n=1 Tax=Pisolithus tinctorius Marx 270 TaxID=870435 RepID=A0A0C3PND4_PISTI|nr:hypothetical protein BKA82DRAFT_995540 [Pisolithus tinctorius]KIO10346.1 hypothetical protein M404DRAFT_995540 [Pisolithus tinctorius Marx 270]